MNSRRVSRLAHILGAFPCSDRRHTLEQHNRMRCMEILPGSDNTPRMSSTHVYSDTLAYGRARISMLCTWFFHRVPCNLVRSRSALRRLLRVKTRHVPNCGHGLGHLPLESLHAIDHATWAKYCHSCRGLDFSLLALRHSPTPLVQSI